MNELNYTPVPNKIRVCHFPQIPCKPFIVEVNNEREAYLIEEVFANQHLWLFKNGFIPDYSNVISVQMWDEDECDIQYQFEGKVFETDLQFKNFIKKNPGLKDMSVNYLLNAYKVCSQGAWVDYWNESECMEWEQFKQTYFENGN